MTLLQKSSIMEKKMRIFQLLSYLAGVLEVYVIIIVYKTNLVEYF